MSPFILYIYRIFTIFLPETRFFGFKNVLLRLAGARIGENVKVCSSVRIIGNGILLIDDNTWIGPSTLISVTNPASIVILGNVDIAPNVYIGTGTHKIDMYGLNSAGFGYNDNIIINSGVWIGVGSMILPGVEIGTKAVVGAGSLVNKNVAPYSVVAGVPARSIKNSND
jgi:acetyltransferase-like isoleucine patch superfamily enzyme